MKKLNVDMLDAALNPSQGHSQPTTVIAENGEKYILKSEPDKENASLAQEILCYELANILDIEVPEYAILKVTKSFLNNNSTYIFSHHINEGIYFGSKYIASENNLIKNYREAQYEKKPYIKRTWNDFFKKIDNIDIYPKIIAFDLLTLNCDRFTNEGNLLVSSEKRKVYPIDFGHCFFGPVWNHEKQDILNFTIPPKYGVPDIYNFPKAVIWIMLQTNYLFGSGFGKIFRAMENNIPFEGINPFYDIVNKIENLPDYAIEKIVYSIPEEWIVGSNIERNLYCSFLRKNKYNIKEGLQFICDLEGFSNYKGGNLDWTQKDKSIGIR